jgi:hypothetical protein
VSIKSTTRRASKQDEIDELKAKLAMLESNQSQGETQETKKIQLDELITVVSLLSYPLNLSTKEKGQGDTFRFESFGQIKKIIYSKLLSIIEVHRNFLEWGYFLILDDRVIKEHGLQETYSKILTKEKIEQILSGSKSGIDLYKSCNEQQQKVIVSMVIEKVRDNPDSIDLNMVDQLSRVSGVNIAGKAEDARTYLNMDKSTEDDK